MKWMLTLVASLVVGQGTALAERAATPADATVFIRLVGSVHAELEEAGAAKQIVDLDRIEIGTGSGFVISPHGYVLTNEHVISNSEFVATDGPRKAKFTLKIARIDVCFPPASASARGALTRCFEASVHSSDAALDLAVLFITASDLPYVALGDSDVLRSGQGVDALGYPFGRGLEVGRVAAPDLVPEISISAGTISALRADDNGDRRVLQINSTVNPGNSGGPVVDREGYAVGVIRARVKGDAGIGFAIPINQAKDFLESRGLDSLMPARRLRLGAVQVLERKALALRLPEGMSDMSPFRSRVESAPEWTDVALRIDRSVSPWTATQLERTLLQTEAFERLSIEEHQSQNVSQAGGVRLLVGRATGMGLGSGSEIAMQYGILDLGAEKLIARYVGSAEQVAYNESVLRGSLLSLDGQRLMSGEAVSADSVEWRGALARGLGCRAWYAIAVCRAYAMVWCDGGVSGSRRDARTTPWHLGRRGGFAPTGRRIVFLASWLAWRLVLCATHGVARCVVCDRRGVRSRGIPSASNRSDFAGGESRSWLALSLQTGSRECRERK